MSGIEDGNNPMSTLLTIDSHKLDIRVDKLCLTGFRCYKEAVIEFEKDLTVLVAPNGVGKSSILDALAIAFGAMLTRLPKIKGTAPLDTDIKVDADGRRAPYMRISTSLLNGITWDRAERGSERNFKAADLPGFRGLSEVNRLADDIFSGGGSFKFSPARFGLLRYRAWCFRKPDA
ncbi:ATP-binding protein [Salinicola tamaricis]|uniref:ATP-binding protein n=1 Tax=Salinicola tamaricis TaxID=1771309 RepID=UPI00101AE610|nr:ATP-binding protein [Salinicola tamaricis]